MVEFRVLGPLEIVGGERVTIGAAKERALVCALVMARGQTVSVDRLVDSLWADRPPASANVSLRVLVSRVRKALATVGAGSIVRTASPGYVLDISDDDVDVHRFERLATRGHEEMESGDPASAAATLRDALSLWRGRAYEEVADKEFAIGEVARLEQIHAATLEERVTADLACGRHAALAGELDALCRAHPLREQLWALRMTALYRSGRQAEALRAYQELRRELDTEVGLIPSPELQALEAAILAHDPSLDLVSAARSSAATSARPQPGALARDARALPPSLAATARDPLLGRADETEVLVHAWNEARTSGPRLMLLAGEPGIGKTRLLSALAQRVLDEGGVALYGRCEEDVGTPYQPFDEALGTLVDSCGIDVLREHVAAHGGELARVAPRLRDRVDTPAPHDGDPEVVRHQLFEGVANLLGLAAIRTPLLIGLDDVHWAGAPSLLLLRHLMRTSAAPATLIVATYRDTEVDRSHPLGQLLPDLLAEPGTSRVALHGLDLAAMTAFVEATLDTSGAETATLAHELRSQTAGNPFFVRALLHHMADDPEGGRGALPEGVKHAIFRRLSRLDERANEALTTASVIGQQFDLWLLEQVLGASDDSVLDAIDAAVASGLVREEATKYVFAHALIRDTLYEEISTARRGRLHRRTAEAIEASPEASKNLAALAFHFGEAALDGQAQKAAAYSLAAGRQALAQLSYEEASVTFRRGLTALEVAPAPAPAAEIELRLALGEALRSAGQHAEARRESLAAANVARADGLTRYLPAIATSATFRTPLGRVDDDVAAVCDDALLALDDATLAEQASVMAGVAEFRSRSMHNFGEAAHLAGEAIRLARQSRDPRVIADVAVRAAAVAAILDTGEALALANEAITAAETAGVEALLALSLRRHAELAIRCGDRVQHDRDLARLESIATPQSPSMTHLALDAARWTAAYLDGRFDDAERLTAEMASAAGGGRSNFAWSIGTTVALAFERGRAGELETMAATFRQAFPELTTALYALRSLAHAYAGHFDLARDDLELVAADHFAAVPRDGTRVGTLSFIATTVYELRDTRHGRELYELLLPYTDQLSTFSAIPHGAVDQRLGDLAMHMEHHDSARAHYETALDLARRLRSPVMRTNTELSYGKLLLTTGTSEERPRAVAMLTSARDAAAAIGMERAEQRASEALGTASSVAP